MKTFLCATAIALMTASAAFVQSGATRQNCSPSDRNCFPQGDGSNKSVPSPITPNGLNNQGQPGGPVGPSQVEVPDTPQNCSPSDKNCLPQGEGSNKSVESPNIPSPRYQ